jgi:hypothetical protein
VRARHPGRLLAGGALIAAGVIAAAVVQCSQAGSKAPPPAAAEFVATNGSDSGRCTQSAPCATLDRAYQVAKPGDVVEVAAGTYPVQTVVQSQPPKPEPAVTFRPAAGTRPTIAGIQLGVNNGQPSGTAPSNLVIDGFNINGQFHASYSGVGTGASNITLRNSHVYGWNAFGPMLLLRDVVNFSAINDEVGPACCQADAIQLSIRNEGNPNPQNVLFDRMYVHDVQDTCHNEPNYPDCSGSGYGDDCGSCEHIDGLQAFGGNGITIRNSRFYNAGTQNIFLQPANRGSFSNILIENTMVSTSVGSPTNSVSVGGPGVSVFGGYVRFLYDTFQKDVRIYEGVLAPGTQVEFTGTIADYRGDDGGGEPCSYRAGDGSTITPTYSHNLFRSKTCGSTDVLGRALYVNPGPATPDLHLQQGSAGLGRADPTGAPHLDIDGDLRPVRRAPDIGADQRETAMIVLGRSIGRLRLGASRMDVVGFFGQPRRVKRFVSTRGTVTVASYRVHGGNLSVWYSGDKVVGAGTTTSYYETAGGNGVGAETGSVLKETRLNWLACRHAYRRNSGAAAVYFTPSGGKEKGAHIDSVLMVSRGFDLPKVTAKKKSKTGVEDCRPKLH